MRRVHQFLVLVLVPSICKDAMAQRLGEIRGRVTDQTGTIVPGVSVELQFQKQTSVSTTTDAAGEYAFEGLADGIYHLSFSLVNFATIHRDITVESTTVRADAVLRVAFNSSVSVTTKATFFNFADIQDPLADLVGVAESASQGAIAAQQLDLRPLLRTGEVMETVPGIIVTQHGGGGKANQYFLRGFNLDHGTDFVQTIAGMPICRLRRTDKATRT